MTEPTGSAESVRTDRNSLDIALEEALKGNREQPLRWVATILEQDPERVMAYYLAGTLLRDEGEPQAGSDALRIAVHFGIREGSLARAAAAICELRNMGEPVAEEIANAAQVFSAGSAHLLDHGAAPPSLVKTRLSLNPAPMTSSHAELVEHVKSLIADAKAQVAVNGDDVELKVSRQVLFSSLDDSGLRSLLNLLELRAVRSGERVVVQGETGEEAFVVARGELEVSRVAENGNATALARLGSGSLVGEMALLAQAPRAAQVVASRPCLLLVLRKGALDALVAEEPELGAAIANYCRRRMIENLIRTSAVLKSVNVRERPELVQRFVTCTYESGQRIITQGEEPEGLHLIASGAVVVVHRENEESTVIATLGVGEVVGEMSLVLRRPAGADVLATMPTVTLHLTSDNFLEIVRAYPGVLSHLYELAVTRDTETRSVLVSEAEDAGDCIVF